MLLVWNDFVMLDNDDYAFETDVMNSVSTYTFVNFQSEYIHIYEIFLWVVCTEECYCVHTKC